MTEDYKDSNSEREQCINKLRDILGNYQNYQSNGLIFYQLRDRQYHRCNTNMYLCYFKAQCPAFFLKFKAFKPRLQTIFLLIL